ncbi:PoNe immunity protein domain-containing protein [Chitinolyticbacter albus]|uniref:PoNe immunity protein domain-containing protein n=1 Tax=Chitinolyticbacter albus TaxID=2961951 RepID=UPI00210B6F78|nr:PoNe immunity protein domain-containing protein [Chitinolyticbacter albus]
MAFKDERRQRFISAAHYEQFRDQLALYIKVAHEKLALPELSERAVNSFKWDVASYALETLILDYTAGKSIEGLGANFPSIIDAFDVFISNEKIKPHVAAALEITQLEAYVYVTWLLALAKLLGHADQIPRILSWIDKNAEFNRGRDGLFEAVVQQLTGTNIPVERVLLHPDAYRPLAKATVLPAEERPAMVAAFLESWYKQMKGCYWHGTHTDKAGDSSYFGYWAFEAALVTVLWDIDDSSYRDHLVYPKDLVDFARSLATPTQKPPTLGMNRCEANLPCPKSGYWQTPAQVNSRRYFEAGEVMPAFSGSTYGATIWYWDENQG